MLRIPYRNRLLLKKALRITLILLAVLFVAALLLLIYAQPYMVYDRDGAHLDFSAGKTDASGKPEQTVRPTVENPEIVYDEGTPAQESIAESGGYYITTSMLQNPSAVLAEVQKLEEPCAVMIELKSIYGYFYYPTSIEGASTADIDISGVNNLITYLVNNNFYLIAEIPAFSDPAFALQNVSCGLPLSSGALWMDENGCYWLDPANDTVLSYLMQIARELSSLGFREIAFSDFRFPVSSSISYPSEQTPAALIQAAAEELTDFFTGSNLTISFVTDSADFPVQVCAGRIYVPDTDGSQADRYTQLYGSSPTLIELVFLTSSRDTRFEDKAVLRPLPTS